MEIVLCDSTHCMAINIATEIPSSKKYIGQLIRCINFCLAKIESRAK